MTGQASHLRWKQTLITGWCFTMAIGIVGCTGQVSSQTPPGGPATGGGAAMSPGTGASGAKGGSGGAGATGLVGGTAGPGTGGVPSQLTPLTLDTGRTVLRRLNRSEYSLTVRDLLGTTATRGDNLPADQIADGFNTVGEYLAVSPLHIETLEATASALADELFALPAADPKRAKVFVCTLTTGAEATCARQILTTFARKAFRRPAKAAEIDSLMRLVDKVRAGVTYNDGLKAGITAILLSPHFLYKEETSVGVGAGAGATAPPKPLNAFELATRLSYFLWSTMPDDALAASADSGKIATDPAELTAQVDRMLADPKSSSLTTGFATQWLTLYRLDDVHFDTKLYPAYDEPLRVAAQQETATFFSKLITDNLPLSTLIDADFTYANARLAKHYGVTATGTALERVSLVGTPRAGVLTQASFLMGNAHPDRSAPVPRGDWILSRILCAATPPPPDNIVIPPFPPASAGISGRKFLEDHRANPMCAACHQFIDPLGLGLENFDAIGAYRTMESGVAVDSTGTYPGGTAFSSAAELTRLIAKDPRYPTCVTKQLLTYGAGRTFSSPPALAYAKALAERATGGGGAKWRSWISMVASSEAFRTNRPEAQ